MPSLTLRRPRGRHAAITEAATPIRAQSPATKVTREGYVWGVPPGGQDENQTGIGASTQTDRKSLLQEMYEAYISCPWAWAAVQSIARTITAGGLISDWTGDTGEGDQKAPDKPPNVLALEALLAFTNPQQNIRQVLRNFIADLLVFGDAYIELVWSGSRVIALFNQDSPTTVAKADVHGAVSGYVQVTDYGERATFDPRDIIHVSLDSARPGVVGLSPMQAALGPVTSWLFAAATGKEEFKKGLPPNIHADFPAAAQDKDIRTWRDQYASKNIGARNIGAPIVSKGGMTVKELQTGKITDVIAGKNQCRDEILSIFGVPPAKAGVIESGNLGGGTGDAQDKTYRIDTCGPIEELVAEAFNFALVKQAFGITDWELKFGEIDYRDSTIIENIRDTRLRNGAWTLNRYRAEIGEPPVPGGDDAVLVDRQNLVLWEDMRDMSKAVVAGKGAPAVVAGEPQPDGDPLPGEDPDDPDRDPAAPPPGAPPAAKPGAKPAKDDPRETLRDVQYRHYRQRFNEALRRLPAVTESGPEDTRQAVKDQLGENFPPAATGWVDDAEWEGPMAVPLADVDISGRGKWAAATDGRVAKARVKLRRRIAEGRHPKPVILVRTPGADKDIIPDGHHRVAAALDEGEATVWAYVGRVNSKTGPWDEMHSSQQ